jgi:hypothetical protein
MRINRNNWPGGVLALLFWVVGLQAPGLATAQTPPEPPAQVAVSPPRFELELGSKPVNESLKVLNLGEDPVTVEVSVYPWVLDENNQVQIVEPDEQSLDQWMVINPLRFTISGGGSQVVRFSIRPRIEPEPGEHRAIIYLKQILPEVTEERAPLRVSFRLGVGVYAWVGDVTREATIHSVELVPASSPPAFGFDISSSGTAHVRLEGQYAVWRADDFPGSEATSQIEGIDTAGAEIPEPVHEVGTLPTIPVLPGTRRSLALQLLEDLPPGDYVLDLNGAVAGVAIDQAIRFEVRSEPGEE